ncbi:nucleotidyl transferase AbiEii/AbiGii toxin family protein [Halorhabdus amylolytica]|uniref:nucleotidyl transferase AbiEii/AbiGii toxin family protein n=1 Tax=Halorhabdus amylolytica TaxID=2559573 RepID=UPI001B7D8E71|nr:nucleotidyl transferase AbiEii/AbiGii toxin family protein [Halorhabdus amylolytica]
MARSGHWHGRTVLPQVSQRKTYVNSWILYAIYQSTLGEHLVFKGGTALSKLYFPDIWRFSEDLDFTAIAQLSSVETDLEEALSTVEVESGIAFEITNFYTAGEPVEYIQVDIQYEAVLGQKNTTTLDITLDESMYFPAKPHTHGFEDVPEFDLQAYTVEEILVEKLRSLYQRARARDYYDIYRLLDQREFDDSDIADALREKAEEQDVELDLENGVPEEDIEDVRDYWNKALDRLVVEKPEFNNVVKQITDYLTKLHSVSEKRS